MTIQKLENCCSLAHLHHIFFYEDISTAEDKYDLKNRLRSMTDSSVKSVMFISDYSFSRRLELRFFYGFRQVGSYKGAEGHKVYIMIIKIRK